MLCPPIETARLIHLGQSVELSFQIDACGELILEATVLRGQPNAIVVAMGAASDADGETNNVF